jgi:DNA primase
VRPIAIEEARSRFRLDDVAERTGIYVPRSGGSVMVRCPFPDHGHFDTSPSLRLRLDDGIWHCFGCGARGDVVEWVRQTEGVGWPEAVRLLDQGGPLKNAWPSAGDERRDARYSASRDGGFDYPEPARTPASRVLAALASAWRHYTSRQLHYSGAQYLVRRGIDVRVLERQVGRFEVGHTPGTATGLVSLLRQQGFSSDELVDAGLATRRAEDGMLFDYYRQRVLVPIRDREGRVCGIVGRNIGDERSPKYKNPPRTCTYDKSNNMYQPLPAPSGSSGQAVVVEGTLDAMAIAVAAIRAGRAEEFCPTTQSGRELSPSQLADIAAFVTPIVLAFDGDAAGHDSAVRHGRSAIRAGLPTWVTTLPGNHDPASWLAYREREGLDAWDVAAHSARSPRPIPARTFLAMETGEGSAASPGLEHVSGPAL